MEAEICGEEVCWHFSLSDSLERWKSDLIELTLFRDKQQMQQNMVERQRTRYCSLGLDALGTPSTPPPLIDTRIRYLLATSTEPDAPKHLNCMHNYMGTRYCTYVWVLGQYA